MHRESIVGRMSDLFAVMMMIWAPACGSSMVLSRAFCPSALIRISAPSISTPYGPETDFFDRRSMSQRTRARLAPVGVADGDGPLFVRHQLDDVRERAARGLEAGGTGQAGRVAGAAEERRRGTAAR